MRPDDKPASPGERLEQLEHHGIKGMHWGIRREDPSGLGKEAAAKAAAKLNDATKEYLSIVAKTPQRSPAEAAKALKISKEKFAQKFEPSGGGSGKGLSQFQKDLLVTAGIGAAYAGLVLVGKKYGVSATGLESLFGEIASNAAELHAEFAGKAVAVEDFQKLVGASQFKTWMLEGNIQESSLLREGFELPAGHTFRRLSTAAETEFADPQGTYATHSIEDYNRYVANFRHEKGTIGLNTITFKTNEPIKVPSLTEVLETGREAWAKDGTPLSRKEAKQVYEKLSGSAWGSDVLGSSDIRSTQLMDALRKKGYGAIVDEMDAGVIGESPLVLFPGGNFTPKTTSVLTVDDIKQAEANLTELTNRKL